MPVFHTKTIESILEPVAQQVTKLVILHEVAEGGSPMPDLQHPVRSVSNAVLNLVQVGRETVNSSADNLLRQDMPNALCRVETSSKLLEEASVMLKVDPYSSMARKRLIDGSGGILQATSALLLCFDESEVRKIIAECHRVVDCLTAAERVNTLDALVQFLRDLSPSLSRVSREVSAREQELTHQVHRVALSRSLDQVKSLAPILICAMKVFVHVCSTQGGRGTDEAASNRNYLVQRMRDELDEMIRVLPLTSSYDAAQSDMDSHLTALKKLQNVIQSRMNAATDWLLDAHALCGGAGESALRQIVEMAAQQVASHCLPADAQAIRRICAELRTMTEAQCELRRAANYAQAETLGRSMRDKLCALQQTVIRAVCAVDKEEQRVGAGGGGGGGGVGANTVAARMELARKWLSCPGAHENAAAGRRAIEMLVADGRSVADGLTGCDKSDIGQLCDEVEDLMRQLCAQEGGAGNSAKAQQIARRLAQKLHELRDRLNRAVVNRVVADFLDVVTPLRLFAEAVRTRTTDDATFNERAHQLQQCAQRAARTARVVATCARERHLTDALRTSADQLDALTPQLVSAGSIRRYYPESRAADEHFENLRQQWADTVAHMRNQCDVSVDAADILRATEEQMRKHGFLCEEAIELRDPQKMVDNTSAIARHANRALGVAQQECDNSEDGQYIAAMQRAAQMLQAAVPPMVQDAKAVAIQPADAGAASKWRDSNRALLNAVGQVRQALEEGMHPNVPPYPDMDALQLGGGEVPPPPRPPLPHQQHGGGRMSPPAPPLPPPPLSQAAAAAAETDDEDDVFRASTIGSVPQPIMAAARKLHDEVSRWSAKDNDLVAAAKRMAALMARLSQLVLCDDRGSKREFIETTKKIAEASADVTRIAKQIARECTDKRIRTNLLQVCERIPTIATQLNILSTVKATMLGSQGTQEDQEATKMLEGNAQNLMQSVEETVRAAEPASVKRNAQQSQGQLRWIRRQPWYVYA